MIECLVNKNSNFNIRKLKLITKLKLIYKRVEVALSAIKKGCTDLVIVCFHANWRRGRLIQKTQPFLFFAEITLKTPICKASCCG